MKSTSKTSLIRALSLSALIIYGLGDILGAGIYALIGKIAGYADAWTWLSFAIAMSIVSLTGLSYSELGSRFPRSGGVSVYIQEAFSHKGLSIIVGVLLLGATLFSMSTLSRAFAGFMKTVGFNFPNWVSILLFFTILLLINLRGIKQSSMANIVSTSVELSGLFIVLICGFLYLIKPHVQPIVTSANNMPSLANLFRGAALAFFAFTGFEDLANVAEEIKQPEKNLPRALLSSLGIAGLLYLSVSWMATAIIPGSQLSQSHSPLQDVINQAAPSLPSYFFTIIAMFAVFNTTLLNYITASRLLYGMSEARLLPRFLQAIHKKYHTPYIAIIIVFPVLLALALTGDLAGLANYTSTLVLMVFSFSSLALIKIKLKEKDNEKVKSIFRIPLFVPFLAIILNITAIVFLRWS
jgi:APA family basic amino acid/polyamine antiporter